VQLALSGDERIKIRWIVEIDMFKRGVHCAADC